MGNLENISAMVDEATSCMPASLRAMSDLVQQTSVPYALSATIEMVTQLEIERQQRLAGIPTSISSISQTLAALESSKIEILESIGDYAQSLLGTVISTEVLEERKPASREREWELERKVRDLRRRCDQQDQQLNHHQRVMQMPMADIRRLADEGDAVAIAAIALVQRNATQRATDAAKARADSRYGPCKELAYRLVKERVPVNGKWPSVRQAALAVADDVVTSEKGREIGLSRDQSQGTIQGWLRHMPDRDSVIVSRSKRR